MRALAIVSFLLSALTLVGAGYAPAPLWGLCLYGLPLAGSLFAIAVTSLLLESLLGPLFRTAAGFLSLALACFSGLHALFAGPPGQLGDGLPLAHLGTKALSIGALGAAIGGAILAVIALRSSWRPTRWGAAPSLLACGAALGSTAKALGIPLMSPVAVLLVTTGGLLYLLGQPAPTPEEPPTEEAAED